MEPFWCGTWDHAKILRKLGIVPARELSQQEGRDLAATSQAVFTSLVVQIVEKQAAGYDKQDVGLVLTGGCALNVKTNEVIQRMFNIKIHIPPAPNDCGISVGAAWWIHPPVWHQPIQYIGLKPWDLDELPRHVAERGATAVSNAEVASLLLSGVVMGVVRGRAEFGPRALGHRSLLCVPSDPDIKHKLNALKARAWYRPVAPIVAIEDLHVITESADLHSPYMSFAPIVSDDAQQRFPGIVHLDGTARLQTVSVADEPWLHSLLMFVRQKQGLALLLNTSFNVKGAPILNTVSDALQILDESAELMPFVLVEDWLFGNTQR